MMQRKQFLTALACLALCGGAAQAQKTDAKPGWWLTPGAARATTVRGGDAGFPGGFGAVASKPEAFRSHSRFVITRTARGQRPSDLLLTQYLPPVDSQGQQGSCTAWATAYYNYTYCVAKRRKWDKTRLAEPKYRFSPAFLYNQLSDGDAGGISVSEAFDMLTATGCATLAEMPYDDKDASTKPSPEAIARAKNFTAERSASLFQDPGSFDVEKIKTFLYESQQPFVLVIPIFNDFPRTSVASDFVYNLSIPATPENLHGTHSVTIIGYDDAKKAFRTVNSWGAKWGDGGYLWLSEAFLKGYSSDGWSVLPGGILARDFSRKNVVMPHLKIAPPATQAGER